MAEGWTPNTPPIRAADRLSVLADNTVVIIHFWAAWNGVDRLFAPVLEGVWSDFEGRIAFRSADVDDVDLVEFCRECKVVNVPALGCFVGGQRVKTIVGCRPAEILRAEFAALLGGTVTPDQPVQQARSPAGFVGWLSSLWRRCC